MQVLKEVGEVPSTRPVCMIMTSVMGYHTSFVGSGASGSPGNVAGPQRRKGRTLATARFNEGT